MEVRGARVCFAEKNIFRSKTKMKTYTKGVGGGIHGALCFGIHLVFQKIKYTLNIRCISKRFSKAYT